LTLRRKTFAGQSCPGGWFDSLTHWRCSPGAVRPWAPSPMLSDNIVSAEFAGLIDAQRIQAATIAKDFGIKPTECRVRGARSDYPRAGALSGSLPRSAVARLTASRRDELPKFVTRAFTQAQYCRAASSRRCPLHRAPKSQMSLSGIGSSSISAGGKAGTIPMALSVAIVATYRTIHIASSPLRNIPRGAPLTTRTVGLRLSPSRE
jgi:hypothetical protein